MKYLTLGEAEREVGVTKSTISRAIKDGRLSANRNEHGHFQIDPAELFRVYDPIGSQGAGEVEYDSTGNGERNPERNSTQQAVQHHATPRNNTDENDMVPWLRERLDKAEEKLAQTEEELEQKEAAYLELREAYNRLPSPDDFDAKVAAERERLAQEKIDALALKQRQHDKAMEAEREQQAKIIANEKQQQAKQHETALKAQQAEQARLVAEQRQLDQQKSEQWEASLAERKREIDAARNEAEVLKQQAAAERAVREALEQRGLIARLLNRKPKMVEG